VTDPSGAESPESPAPGDAGRAQQAREALARARADALARGSRPATSAARRPSRGALPDRALPDRVLPDRALPPPGGAPGRRARTRREDPEPLHAAIDDLISARGWREDAAGGSVAGRWAQIVGADLAAHTRPDRLADGELTVTADSTAWATQVRLLAAQLVRRLNAELGDGVVRQVRVRGPASAAGPARRPGEWRVRGGRGPRDTYG
jgi:predicted nucleic acid-binding Zn ribbon protein